MSKSDAEKHAKALDWAYFLMKNHPGMDKIKAAEETAVKFNLGPLEEEWLINQLTQGQQ
jgi:hypothetical protein